MSVQLNKETKAKKTTKVVSKLEVKSEPEIVSEPEREVKSEPEEMRESETEQELEPESLMRTKLVQLIEASTSQYEHLRKSILEQKRILKDFDAMVRQRSKRSTRSAPVQKREKKERDYSKPPRLMGFAEPRVVDDVLYKFLVDTKADTKDYSFVPSSEEEAKAYPRVPITKGMKVAKNDVVSWIQSYITANDLCGENKAVKLDAHLKNILPEDAVSTRTSMLKYVSKFFV